MTPLYLLATDIGSDVRLEPVSANMKTDQQQQKMTVHVQDNEYSNRRLGLAGSNNTSGTLPYDPLKKGTP